MSSSQAARTQWSLFLAQHKSTILIAAAALSTIAAFCVDDWADDFVRAHQGSPWRTVAWFMTRYADWPFLVLYALLFFIAGVFWKNRRWKSLASAMIVTCFVTGVTATAIRFLTGRTRPHDTIPQGWYGVRKDSHWIIGKADFASFPSGHVGAAVGFVMPMILYTRRGKVPAVVFCVLLAWARVFTGYHHVSDVTVAAVLGIAGGIYTSRRLLPGLFSIKGVPEILAGDAAPVLRHFRS